MKRLLSLLAAIGITATASSASVSCTAIHHHRNTQLTVTAHPTFSIASISPDIHSDDWTDDTYINTVYVSGIDLDKLPDFKAENFVIKAAPDSNNAWSGDIEVETAVVEPSNTDITLTLKGKGIKVPNTVTPADGDKYTVSYIDNKSGFSITGIDFIVYNTHNDSQ